MSKKEKKYVVVRKFNKDGKKLEEILEEILREKLERELYIS